MSNWDYSPYLPLLVDFLWHVGKYDRIQWEGGCFNIVWFIVIPKPGFNFDDAAYLFKWVGQWVSFRVSGSISGSVGQFQGQWVSFAH